MAYSSRLAAAEALAADLTEPGMEIAGTVARATAAGVHPDAMASLILAAITLTDNDPQTRALLFAHRDDPHRTNLEYLEDVAEHENALRDLLKHAADLGGQIEGDLTEAEARAGAALAEKRKQENLARTAANEAARSAAERAARQAQLRYEAARRVIGDCEAALEVLDEYVLPRLERALKQVQAAPEDLAEYFDVPYEMARQGKVQPHDGHWVQPADAA